MNEWMTSNKNQPKNRNDERKHTTQKKLRVSERDLAEK